MVKRVYTSEVEATEELPEPITFKLDGVEYIIMREDDVLGILDMTAKPAKNKPAKKVA